MRRWLPFLLVALGLVLAQGEKLKACFIYVGPVGDAGWTYAHDLGRKKAEAALPWLETRYVESVPEAQALPVIDRLVREGCRVIFATSFGYGEAVLEAAKKYPDVLFAHATGVRRAPNVATYMADFYQVYYLNGLAAGALSKTGKVGYVAAYPIPEVKRHINAFALGVRAVNPKAQVLVRWINAWYDPAKAREATEALLAQGADVFAFTEDSPTVVQTAARKGAYSFGHYTPMLKFAPDRGGLRADRTLGGHLHGLPEEGEGGGLHRPEPTGRGLLLAPAAGGGGDGGGLRGPHQPQARAPLEEGPDERGRQAGGGLRPDHGPPEGHVRP